MFCFVFVNFLSLSCQTVRILSLSVDLCVLMRIFGEFIFVFLVLLFQLFSTNDSSTAVFERIH